MRRISTELVDSGPKRDGRGWRIIPAGRRAEHVEAWRRYPEPERASPKYRHAWRREHTPAATASWTAWRRCDGLAFFAFTSLST